MPVDGDARTKQLGVALPGCVQILVIVIVAFVTQHHIEPQHAMGHRRKYARDAQRARRLNDLAARGVRYAATLIQHAVNGAFT